MALQGSGFLKALDVVISVLEFEGISDLAGVTYIEALHAIGKFASSILVKYSVSGIELISMCPQELASAEGNGTINVKARIRNFTTCIIDIFIQNPEFRKAIGIVNLLHWLFV